MGACVQHNKQEVLETKSFPVAYENSPKRKINTSEELKKSFASGSSSKSVEKCMSSIDNVSGLSDSCLLGEVWACEEGLQKISLNSSIVAKPTLYEYRSISLENVGDNSDSEYLWSILDSDLTDEVSSSMNNCVDDDLNVGKLQSFDGLNKRVVNRYDLGLEVLKAMIHHGTNPEGMSTHGSRTALMFAVLAQDLGFIKKLVELGVDLNETNCRGETALSLANETGRCDIINYLRSKGAIESEPIKEMVNKVRTMSDELINPIFSSSESS